MFCGKFLDGEVFGYRCLIGCSGKGRGALGMGPGDDSQSWEYDWGRETRDSLVAVKQLPSS